MLNITYQDKKINSELVNINNPTVLISKVKLSNISSLSDNNGFLINDYNNIKLNIRLNNNSGFYINNLPINNNAILTLTHGLSDNSFPQLNNGVSQ